SEATAKAAGPALVVGSRRKVQLRGRSTPTDAFEIIGIAAGDADHDSVQIPEEVRQALAANARVAADAAKAALGITLSIMTGEIGEKRLTVQGYRIVSKIGRGGSAIVYLAERESDKQQVVLKILNATAGMDEILLQRFVQEFDIISSIDHPNVVKIYDRGFSDRQAYLAMEYFPNGSLAELIPQGLSGRQALSLLAQAAARCARFTPAASSTAISSREISWRAPTAASSSPTSASRSGWGTIWVTRGTASSTGLPTTFRRSRSKAAPQRCSRIFTHSGSFFTRC